MKVKILGLAAVMLIFFAAIALSTANAKLTQTTSGLIPVIVGLGGQANSSSNATSALTQNNQISGLASVSNIFPQPYMVPGEYAEYACPASMMSLFISPNFVGNSIAGNTATASSNQYVGNILLTGGINQFGIKPLNTLVGSPFTSLNKGGFG